jgi:hypothetical protein
LREVFANGAADNFEKAELLYAALRAVGVGASFVATGRNPGLTFDHAFPLPGHFDHLLLQVLKQPDVAEPFFVDPSCEACAPGQLPDWDDDREGLALRDHRNFGLGADYQTEFVSLHGQPAAQARGERTTFEATLGPSGDTSGTALYERAGSRAVDYMINVREWSVDKRRETLERRFQRVPSMRTHAAVPERCDPATATCRASLTWEAPAYATREGGKWVIPLALLPSSSASSSGKRRSTIMMTHPDRREEIVRFRLPEGWVAEELPTPVTVRTPLIDVEVEATREPGLVMVRRTVVNRAGTVEAAEWPKVAEALRAFDGIGKRSFVIAPP